MVCAAARSRRWRDQALERVEIEDLESPTTQLQQALIPEVDQHDIDPLPRAADGAGDGLLRHPQAE
jgi:hypothetical protein